MKVSIITVVYNGEQYIKDCLESVLKQNYNNIEYIVVDGQSTDRTLAIVKNYQSQLSHFISEPDRGMYDALNKGIALAKGDIIGILNADDVLASHDVIGKIVNCFKENQADAVYGNLNYVDQTNTRIIRKWVSKPFKNRDLQLGWMPAHPTLYVRRALFTSHGNYSLNFGTAADYELMLRFFSIKSMNAVYLNKLIVNMRVGGMSNASIKQRYLAFMNDYKAAKNNQIPFPLGAIVLKKIGKLKQFLH